jgi:elongation factor Ts
MAITTEQIKELRNLTGVSVMQCKNALEEAGGDIDKAKIILQKLSSKAASKKSDRILKAGTVSSYIHAGGNIGTLVELQCETDFVAKNSDFQDLAKEIAMQVAATNPSYIKEEDINDEDRKKATEVFEKEVDKDKPEEVQKKILEGKLDSYFKEKVLLKQDYIKDPSKTVNILIEEAIQKIGERIEVGRIARFSVVE